MNYNYFYKRFNDISIAISYKNKNFYNENDMSDNDERNIDNRLYFFKQLNIESKNIFHPKQIHSNMIFEAQRDRIECDGFYTFDKSKALYILTADCYNIFYFNNNEFGVIHAGWRSIEKGIIENLRKRLNKNAYIVIAQGICFEHFEVREDVASMFYKKYSSDFIVKKNNSYFIDLRGIINNILKDYNKYNINLCNKCNNDKLFSHRYENTKYRNMSIIWRNDV